VCFKITVTVCLCILRLLQAKLYWTNQEDRFTGSQQADFITAFVSYTNITIPNTVDLYTVQYQCLSSVESISVFCIFVERFKVSIVHDILYKKGNNFA